MADHWLSFVYQYVVGGLFFLFIVIWALKCGAIGWRSREDKKTLLILFGGLALFFMVHGLWTYLLMGF